MACIAHVGRPRACACSQYACTWTTAAAAPAAAPRRPQSAEHPHKLTSRYPAHAPSRPGPPAHLQETDLRGRGLRCRRVVATAAARASTSALVAAAACAALALAARRRPPGGAAAALAHAAGAAGAMACGRPRPEDHGCTRGAQGRRRGAACARLRACARRPMLLSGRLDPLDNRLAGLTRPLPAERSMWRPKVLQGGCSGAHTSANIF